MTFQNFILLLQAHGWEIGIILVIAGCIKIPTYEIRLLPFLLKKALRGFGSVINEDIVNRIEILETGFTSCSVGMRNELNDFIKRSEEERIDRARSRILRFNDEIMMHERHSKEHFDEILEDINKYEKYCREHEEYENNKAILAIKTIKEEYSHCLLHPHHFLTYNKQDEWDN